MSLTSSFGTQIAAIMDVLTKAAVAEITKLVDEGTVVLRLEMCRRDSEIEELKRSLQLTEMELCKAQEAAAEATTARIPHNNRHEHAVTGIQIPHNTDPGDTESCSMYMDSRSANSLFETGPHSEDSRDRGSLVKSEPVDKLPNNKATMNDSTVNNILDFNMEKRDGPVWLAGQSVCEQATVEPEHAIQQCLQIFSSHGDQYPTHSDTESSCNPPSTPGNMVGDVFNAVVKVEPQLLPVCMESTVSEPTLTEQYRHVLDTAVGEDHILQPRVQQPGPSQMQKSRENMLLSNALHGEDHILNRNRLKIKRPLNVWRAGSSQKLFVCSVCGKGFPRFCQLEVHQFSHGAVKPFRCLECGKSFTQKTRLKTHQSVHTGERPFSCKICGKMFSRQDNCLRHERFHSGLKPYSCQQCGKSFTVLGNLKIHQEIHLRGR